jgi:tRNA-uridine 2-sulfurtransferase
MGKKVAVGISGGVDSAVSALLLKQRGFDVMGVHLYCWPPKSEIEKDNITRTEWFAKNGCRADEDRKSALKTALELGIPFKNLDFSEKYKTLVIDYFYREYEAGRTPNPDVLCNSEIKFGLFLEWAIKNNFDYVATGHYAQVAHQDSKHTKNRAHSLLAEHVHLPRDFRHASSSELYENNLLVPKDKHKDQTYFLWKLTQKELKYILFPLGDYLKKDVRKIAKEASLSVADRKDSQGICFVGDVDVQKFLRRRLKEKPGRVVDTSGKIIGTHKGVWFYTIGQRGGWNLTPAGQKRFATDGATPAMYVIEKDAKKNILTVGFGAETYKGNFGITNLNLINSCSCALPAGRQVLSGACACCARFLSNENHLLVRIRHGGDLIKAKVKIKNSELLAQLEDPQRGVAAGQSAVFYADGKCLGGGVIL